MAVDAMAEDAMAVDAMAVDAMAAISPCRLQVLLWLNRCMICLIATV